MIDRQSWGLVFFTGPGVQKKSSARIESIPGATLATLSRNRNVGRVGYAEFEEEAA